MAVALLAGCGTRAADAAAVEEVPEFPAGAPCDYCDGVIPETRFGGELETRDGRTFRFMSAECLAGFVAEGACRRQTSRGAGGGLRARRAADRRGGCALRADAVGEQPQRPRTWRVSTEKVAGTLHYFFGGERMTWAEVVALVAAEWELN
jgi:hypothetical protein